MTSTRLRVGLWTLHTKKKTFVHTKKTIKQSPNEHIFFFMQQQQKNDTNDIYKITQKHIPQTTNEEHRNSYALVL